MKFLYDDSIQEERLDRKYQKMFELQEQQDNRRFFRENYKVSDNEITTRIKCSLSHCIHNFRI